MKINNILVYIAIIIFGMHCAVAEEADTSEEKSNMKKPSEFREVITDYKEYLTTVTAEIREEIVEYRKSVAKLNKQKKLLYKRLSQDAQDYLKKEQRFKSKLPLTKDKMAVKAK